MKILERWINGTLECRVLRRTYLLNL